MKSKLINNNPKTYVLVFDTGDEVMEGIQHFAQEERLSACSFKAIGAFSNTDLGYYDLDKKVYNKIPVNEQVEVLSVIGDISMLGNKYVVHAHAVVGKADGTAHGGHLLKAFVRPTLEVVLTESPSFLYREMNKEAGIPLIKL